MNIVLKMVLLVATGAGLMTAGCGTSPAPPGGIATGHVTGRSAGPAAATVLACVTPVLESGSFSVTERDNGRTYCVTTGSSVYVFLHGTLARGWDPPRATSADLAARPSGMFSLPVGVTAGLFLAVRPGTVSLISARAGCGSAGHCTGPSGFRIRLVIRAQG